MSSSKLRRQLTVAVITIGIAVIGASMFAIGFGAQSSGSAADDGSKLVGDWTGESICVGNNPSCHDEKVIYHVSKSSTEANKYTIAADKIVDGKPEPMGILDFKYDGKKGTLVGEFQNSRYHGLWEYTVKGNVMEGTLSLLPDRTIVRRIKVKKEE
jgi:hypothetical protein